MTEVAEKYIALWNEPNDERRGRMIAELWTEDGRHILQPPDEIRRALAARPGIALTAILEARGHEELEARAASAYEHWVGAEGLSFADQAGRLHALLWQRDGHIWGVGGVIGADEARDVADSLG